VLRGGLFAMAMPRGLGQSTISECARIRAGHDGDEATAFYREARDGQSIA